MAKIIDLENEKKFIKNKEHLSKEDYERIAEIEIEISEIKKSGKDNNVTAKKTNRKMLENMSNEELAEFICNKRSICEMCPNSYKEKL